MSVSEVRFAVVTGVSRGLGRAMVEGLVARGVTVAGCGRSAEDLETLAEHCGELGHFTVLDVTDDQAVAQWARECCTRHGSPDLLLNNAGIINRNARLWELSASEFDTVVDVNIKGVANCVRHFMPAMLERQRGVIVNFSSGWGRSTSADVAPYCATKWAIEGLTQALAQELPSGMAAIPLNPGVINTDMLQSCFGSMAQHYPTAAEWGAAAVPFLLKLGPRHNGQPMSVPI